MIWDRDAGYTYYKHGPLASVQIGDQGVQNLQYAYTVQGWLKAINGDILRPEDDMGQDGTGGGNYPADVMSHTLSYFNGDYNAIGDKKVSYTDSSHSLNKGLYNGNIARQNTVMSPKCCFHLKATKQRSWSNKPEENKPYRRTQKPK